MATILCLETATTNCSVALSVNGSVISLREDNNKQYSHAERLHLFIEEVLKEAKLNITKLDAIAVSMGPGSYTGLRIGVASAKGLCFALNLPLISIATLEALSLQVSIKSGCIIPMLDARRMEVYSTVFSSENKKIRATRAEILTEDSFSEYLDQGVVYFIGTGVAKFENICGHPNAIFLKDAIPSSSQMAELAEKAFRNSDFEDIAYFEPYYLKDFIGG